MSAEIIPFVPRPRGERKPSDFLSMLHCLRRPDDLVMDHADTAPCEYSPPWENDDATQGPA